MKKITFVLLSLFCYSLTFGQTYTTGLLQLSSTSGLEYSAQIDVNSTTVILTMIGPENRWLGLGFGVQSMTSGGDCVIYDGTTLTDRSFGFEGQEPGQDATGINPQEDEVGEQDWNIISNTVSSGVRTIVASRPVDTGNPNDYVFSPSATALELVWARARFEGFNLEWHGPANRGITMQGLTLSQDENSLSEFSITPNPSKTSFDLSLPAFIEEASIEVYDVLGKQIYETRLNALSASVDVSQWNTGVYLIRVSTENKTHTKRFIKQ